MDGITEFDMSLSKLQEIVKDREAWRAAVHGVPKSWIRFSNWTTTTFCTRRLGAMLGGCFDGRKDAHMT